MVVFIQCWIYSLAFRCRLPLNPKRSRHGIQQVARLQYAGLAIQHFNPDSHKATQGNSNSVCGLKEKNQYTFLAQNPLGPQRKKNAGGASSEPNRIWRRNDLHACGVTRMPASLARERLITLIGYASAVKIHSSSSRIRTVFSSTTHKRPLMGT